MVSELGFYIRRNLERLDQTQVWLADQLSVSNNAVSKWIKTGKISRRNYLDLIKLLGKEGAPGLDFDAISEAERDLMDAFRKLPPERQDKFRLYISAEADVRALESGVTDDDAKRHQG